VRRAVLVPALFLMTCSGKDGPTLPAGDAYPTPGSGSRLHAQYLQAEDGTRTFAGWLDTTRGESCRFSVADDGEVRCLPARNGAVDRGCVDPAVTYRQGAVCQPRYAADSTGRAVYALDPAGMAGPVVVGTCTLGGPDQVTYRAKKVLASEFVRARRARREADPGQRLVAFDLVADDGAVEPRGWYDVNLSVECAPAIAADGNRRCLPLADPCLRADAYLDGACTHPVSSTAVGCNVPASLMYVRGPHPLASLPFTCADDRIDVYRLGAPDPGGQDLFRFGAGGRCEAADKVSGARRALSPVDPETFALFPAPPAPHRLRDPLAGLQCPVGCALETTFQDAALGFPCRFTATPDGLRCLPPGRATVYYADAACSRQLAGGEGLAPQRCLGAAGRQVTPAQAAVSAEACSPVTQAVTLGAVFTGPVYQRAAGGCTPAVTVTPLFEIRTSVDMTRFSAGAVVTD
jgi:hypothetical protein